MTLPFLNIPLTTTHCLIGVGAAVGVPIVGCGGYYIYDSSTSSCGKKLSRKGYTGDIASFQPDQLNTSQTKIEGKDKGKLNRLGCFNKFFPGAKATEEQEESSSTFSMQVPNPPTTDNIPPPIGCMLAKIDGTDKEHFTFKSEITVRNDKFGWAIGTHNHRDGVPQQNVQRQKTQGGSFMTEYDFTLGTYHILFLEKNTEDNGEVKGGYYLADQHYYDGKNGVSIVPPGQKSWVHENNQSTSYSGVGLPNSSGKEVFEDIKFLYGGSTGTGLGRSRGNANLFDETSTPRYFKFNGFYDTNKNKWIKDSNNGETVTGLGQKLEPLYQPFKDKKGKGHSTSKYCNSLYYKKTLSPDEENRFAVICFRKSGT